MENTLVEFAEGGEDVSEYDLANLAKSVTEVGNVNEVINCDANDLGFERIGDEQIVNGALGMVSKESEAEESEQ